MENDVSDLRSRLPKALVLGGSALILGFIFNYFFYEKSLGISFPLYIGLSLTTILGIAFYLKIKIPKIIIVPMVAALFFASMVFIRASETLTTINILTTLFLLYLILQIFQESKIRNYIISDYVKTALKLPFQLFAKGWNFFIDSLKLRVFLKGHKLTGQIFKGILMAIPVIIVFLALFSSADLVFEKYVTNFTAFKINGSIFDQVLLILLIAYIFSGIFYYITEKTPETVNASADHQNSEILEKTGSIEIATFLALINILFLGFILIQLVYLFGGESNITSLGFTYAEYARRGFFELNAVAILSFFIILLAEKAIIKKHPQHPFIFKLLSGVLILQLVIIMISAFKRLGIYENIYGYTELRLYSHLFIVWLGLIFLLLFYKIVIDKRNHIFAFNGLIVSLIFIASLNLLNPDAFIARENIRLFPERQRLDLYYLSTLSDDAIPEVIKVFSIKDENLKKVIGYSSFQSYLNTYDRYYQQADSSWQTWHFAKMQAKNIIEAELKK